MAELLLEILSEEIPARDQRWAADTRKGDKLVHGQLTQDLVRLFHDLGFVKEIGIEQVHTYATPRRLVGIVTDIPGKQPDLPGKKGPRVGSPQKAIEGFARSVGVDPNELDTVTENGKAYFIGPVRPGEPVSEVLAERIVELLRGFAWPKTMRWGESVFRWVRPITSILTLFDGKPLEGGLTLAIKRVAQGEGQPDELVPVELPFTAKTRGHRFLAPEPFTVTSAAEYREKLREARIVLDAGERRAMIAQQAGALAGAEGLRVRNDPALLDENAGMVERPWVRMGQIDPAFMTVPAEVLITAMRTHQRYFALEDAAGALAPRFLLVAGVPGEDEGAAIVAGNERVLRARLADARFFWDQDLKRGLPAMRAALGGVVFHARLGSLGDKANRLEALTPEIAAFVPGGEAQAAAEAGGLAKADLTSGMVGEFPDLQGVMGRYYALHEGRSAAVAEAINEHYAPVGPADAPPATPTGRAVALADKIDTLVGFFAIGETPTGSKDPFALRRAALGVIRIVVEGGLRLPLRDAFAAAFRGYVEQGLAPGSGEDSPTAAFAAGIAQTLLAFFAERLKVALRDRGVRHDLIAAVFAAHADDDLVRLLARVEALGRFLASDDGANLLVAYRRAANIVRIEEKRDRVRYGGEVDPALLRQPEEIAVAERLFEVAGRAEAALAHEEFAEAMAALARLRGPVDAFFEKVTVNCDDPALRRNRLRLLAGIRAALDRVADFSRIQGGGP